LRHGVDAQRFYWDIFPNRITVKSKKKKIKGRKKEYLMLA